MTRRSYTIVLEITPTAPLTHGMGNEGNEQQLLTRQVLAQTPDGWQQVDIPAVSGAAMRAGLRECAVADALERAGIQQGEVSRDALRLLLKGGRNDSGGASVSLAAAREMRDLYPLLSVFGSMDGGLPIKGKLEVSDVLPWCQELADAGLLPRNLTPLHVTIDGVGAPEAAIPVFGRIVDADGTIRREEVPPVPAHLVRSSVTYYRHDMLSSRLAPMIATEEARQVEDKRAEVAAKKDTKGATKPDKSERREANESMPHSMQCIVAGTPMVCVLRLQDATDVEFACLLVAVARWKAAGAHLGGAAAKGHGACSVRAAGAIASDPVGIAARAGELVTTDPAGTAYDAYAAHIAARAEKIRAHAAESTR